MNVKHYPRVSSKKQADTGDSVEYQINSLNNHSKSNNDNVVSEHLDAGKSASISDDKIQISHKDGFIHCRIDIRKRAGMNDILDSLKDSDWEALKITKWDRFSRNNIFSQLMLLYFQQYNKRILAIDDSNDSLVRDLMGVLSEREVTKMKGRIRDSRVMRFDNGMFPARSPFGYKPIIKDKKIVGFDIHPKEHKIVLDCFKMTSEGNKYSVICKKHNIKAQSYYNIIKNPAYCGYVQFEGKIKKGNHEPIISEELFKKLNPDFKFED